MAPHERMWQDTLPEHEDVANAIAFLASDQAQTITGVLLPHRRRRTGRGSLAGNRLVPCWSSTSDP
jgi:NAD(P)-dependent dehydrogenase (short-subunit alcohol dehydrogenase family)